MDLRKKYNIYILVFSIVLVISLPFINGSRENLNSGGYKNFLVGIYGFPFDWLHLYPNNGFSFLWIGFIVNIIIFYYIIRILIWFYNKIFGKTH